MKYLVIPLLLLASCSTTAQSPAPKPTPSDQAQVQDEQPTTARRRFKIKLTLTNPEDLKVAENDNVIVGQILADRVKDRTRLQYQRDSLVREIDRLRKLQNAPVPGVAALPAADYGEEAAEIERLHHKAEDAQRRREQQQRKLDVLRTLPQADLPEAVIPHEEIVLQQREREANQAAADLELGRGKLSKAKTQRQAQEYQHSLEMSKRAIAIREQELSQQGQLAELEARLSQVEVSLSQLSAVRSPYSGTVQRIKFEGQNDQNLSVELTLLVDANVQRPGATTQATPNNPPGKASSPGTTGTPQRGQRQTPAPKPKP